MLAAGLGVVATRHARAADSNTGPGDVGRKFEANGRVRPFAGNIIIAHLPQQGPGFAAFDRLLNIYRDLPVCAFARKVTSLADIQLPRDDLWRRQRSGSGAAALAARSADRRADRDLQRHAG